MKKSEYVLCSLLILGLIFKALHIPGYSLFIVVPLLLLNILYLFFSFLLFNRIPFSSIYREESYRLPVTNYFLSFVSGFSLSLLMIGILYRTMHYNNGILIMIVGLIMCGISLIYILLSRERINFPDYTNIVLRFIISIGIGILILAIRW